MGELTGARVLAELGDDRTRFADARAVKAYADGAPVTRASGKSAKVMHRRIKNQRLAAAGYHWAFSALTASPGARAHYDRRRAAGDRRAAAQRNLFNRMIGCLHYRLTPPDLPGSHRLPRKHTPPDSHRLTPRRMGCLIRPTRDGTMSSSNTLRRSISRLA